MSPLYTTLALWIGALLIMVTIRPAPSRRIEEELGGISLPQQFLGRFGIVSLLSFAQSTVLAIGNMLFLGVQVENPLLYLLVYWIGGQVFAFIIYTLVVSFAIWARPSRLFFLSCRLRAAVARTHWPFCRNSSKM